MRERNSSIPSGKVYKKDGKKILIDTRKKLMSEMVIEDDLSQAETRSNAKYQPPKILNRFKQYTEEFNEFLDKRLLSFVNSTDNYTIRPSENFGNYDSISSPRFNTNNIYSTVQTQQNEDMTTNNYKFPQYPNRKIIETKTYIKEDYPESHKEGSYNSLNNDHKYSSLKKPIIINQNLPLKKASYQNYDNPSYSNKHNSTSITGKNISQLKKTGSHETESNRQFTNREVRSISPIRSSTQVKEIKRQNSFDTKKPSSKFLTKLENIKEISPKDSELKEDNYRFIEIQTKVVDTDEKRYYDLQKNPLTQARLSEKPKSKEIYIFLI